MHKLQRAVTFDQEIGQSKGLKPVSGKISNQIPVIRSKSRVLTDVSTLHNNRPNNADKSGKFLSLERQRSNAAKLCKGYSVVHSEDKENQVIGKQTVESLKKLTICDDAKNKRETLKKQTSVTNENANPHKAPLKVVKGKKPTNKLAKAVSVTSLYSTQVLSKVINKPELAVERADKPLLVDDDDDVKHEHDEFLLGLYAKDIFRFLRDLEQSQAVRENYLTSSHLMNDIMRSILVDWMYEVQDSFQLLQDTIQIAIALVDRFAQDNPSIGKDELQLLGVSCIFIASKYEEMYPPSLDDLVHISANACTKNQILAMEQRVVRALMFNFGRPPPTQFLRRYSRVAAVGSLSYTFSKYFVDLAMVHYSFAHVPPSLLSAAAILIAIFITTENAQVEEIWSSRMVFYSDYTLRDVQPLAIKLAKLVANSSKQKFKTVYEIYKDSRRLSVSLRPEVSSSRLVKFIKGSE